MPKCPEVSTASFLTGKMSTHKAVDVPDPTSSKLSREQYLKNKTWANQLKKIAMFNASRAHLIPQRGDRELLAVPQTIEERQRKEQQSRIYKAIDVGEAMLKDQIQQSDDSAQQLQATIDGTSVGLPVTSIKDEVGTLDNLENPSDELKSFLAGVMQLLKGLQIPATQIKSLQQAVDAYPSVVSPSQRIALKKIIAQLQLIEKSIDPTGVPEAREPEYTQLKNVSIPFVVDFINQLLDYQPPLPSTANQKLNSGNGKPPGLVPANVEVDRIDRDALVVQAQTKNGPVMRQAKPKHNNQYTILPMGPLYGRLPTLDPEDYPMANVYGPAPGLGTDSMSSAYSTSTPQSGTFNLADMQRRLDKLTKGTRNDDDADFFDAEGPGTSDVFPGAKNVDNSIEKKMILVDKDKLKAKAKSNRDERIDKLLENEQWVINNGAPVKVEYAKEVLRDNPDFKLEELGPGKKRSRTKGKRKVKVKYEIVRPKVSLLEGIKSAKLKKTLFEPKVESNTKSSFLTDIESGRSTLRPTTPIARPKKVIDPDDNSIEAIMRNSKLLKTMRRVNTMDDNDDSASDGSWGDGLKPRHHLKMTKDGKFGKLKINMKKFKQMRLHARKGRKDVAEGPLSPDLHDLLTKRFNNRRTYSQESINAYRKLAQLAEIPPLISAHNKKAKILQGRINPAPKKTTTSSTKTKYVLWKSTDDLVKRLHVITGSIDAGNASPELKEEASQILDILKDHGVLSEPEYVSILDSIM